MTKVKESIKRLCANLDACGGIKTVSKENIEELNSYISHPEEGELKVNVRAQKTKWP